MYDRILFARDRILFTRDRRLYMIVYLKCMIVYFSLGIVYFSLGIVYFTPMVVYFQSRSYTFSVIVYFQHDRILLMIVFFTFHDRILCISIWTRIIRGPTVPSHGTLVPYGPMSEKSHPNVLIFTSVELLQKDRPLKPGKAVRGTLVTQNHFEWAFKL